MSNKTIGHQERNLLENLIGQILDEKYQIDRLLGQGGMGAVFKATHLGTKRTVALKVIAPQFMSNQEFVERFRREAEAAGRLRHPNVVNVTDFGFATLQGSEFAYLVMEYLDGRSLATLLRKQKTLPLGFITEIVEQIALAIDSAHKRGIVHRDLKPDNIWLESNGRGGYNVIVLDFGLAKLRDVARPDNNYHSNETPLVEPESITAKQPHNSLARPAITSENPAVKVIGTDAPVITAVALPDESIPTSIKNTDTERTLVQVKGSSTRRQLNAGSSAGNEHLTMAGMVIGTPLYMSPEQCRGEPIDARSDIYSLAVITYEALAGAPPFQGTIEEILSQHRKAIPPSLTEKRRDLPQAIASLIMLALEKNPTRRPTSAMAFATGLRVNISGEVPLLRQAGEICREIYPTLAGSFLITLLPLITLVAVLLIVLLPTEASNSFYTHLFHNTYWIWLSLLLLLAQPFFIAGYTLTLRQWQSATRQVNIRDVLTSFKTSGWSLFTTVVSSLAINIFHLEKLRLPGIRTFIDYALLVPVVIFEGKTGTAARSRSRELVNRVRPIATNLQARLFFWYCLSLLFPIVMLAATGLSFDIFYALKAGPYQTIIALFYTALMQMATIQTHLAVVLLYEKARQANGEEASKIVENDFEHLESIGQRQTSRWRVVLLFLLLPLIIFFIQLVKKDPLLLAAEKGQSDTIRVLIEKGTDINVRNYHGETALMHAAAYGRVSIIEMLVSARADINAIDDRGETALMYAARNGRSFSAKALLSAGAGINALNKQGKSALIIAAENGHSDVIKELLPLGVDLQHRAKNGKSALDYARDNEHPETVKMLERVITHP